MAVGKSTVNIFFNGGKHIFGVFRQLFEYFFIIPGVLQLEVVGLSRYHEQILEAFLLNEK